MPSSDLNALEQSFADFAAKHRLRPFSVAYRGEEFGPQYRFDASGHFDDAAPGEHPCATGSGATIAAALGELLLEVARRRAGPSPVNALADATLVADAA